MIIPQKQRFAYDQAVRMIGCHIVEIDTREELDKALEEPVAVRGLEFERRGEAHVETGTAVLVPTELEDRLAPALQVYAGEEPLRSRLRAVRAFPGRKNVWSKGSCTS